MNHHLRTMNADRERLVLAALSGGLLALPKMGGDQLALKGVYQSAQTGPVEYLRSEFIELRDQIEVARSLHSFDLEDRLLAQMSRIPQEIKDLKTAYNLITTVGKNHLLDTELAGSGYTAAWYLLLISSVSYTSGPAAGDTSASHGGWTESAVYSNATRPAASWSAASGGAKALSSGAVFNINASDTIKGCGLISNSTKSGTTGTLFSAGLFSGGDQVVQNGNTLTVSYSVTS